MKNPFHQRNFSVMLNGLLLLIGLFTGTPDTLSISRHWHFLSSDQLEGRGTGTRGERIAGDYIISQLKESGLKPIPGLGYEQKIPMHGGITLPGTVLSLHTADSVFQPVLHRDYGTFTTGASTFLPEPVDLVFVGYGIVAPDFDYNDYQTVDVTGKVVVYLSGEPPSTSADYFDGPRSTAYSLPAVKHRTAIGQGAAGTIQIYDPDREDRPWSAWMRELAFEEVIQSYSITSGFSILLHKDLTSWIFESSPLTYTELLGQEKRYNLSSFPLKTRLSFHGSFRSRDFLSRNILAVAGDTTNWKNSQILLVSAHYDHLGMGQAMNRDSIYNGAMDNAIGVSVTLEVARILAKDPPAIPVVFLFTTGEEKGLLGSIYYTNFPIRPLSSTVACINIDGINFLDPSTGFLAIGGSYSTLGKMASDVLERKGLDLIGIPAEVDDDSFLRSDHYAFAQAGIPSVSLLEGPGHVNLSDETAQRFKHLWDLTIYHSPFDDSRQYINWKAVEQHASVYLAYLKHVAATAGDVKWYRSSSFRQIRLQTQAENR